MAILWIKKWSNTAAKSRISLAKQMSITDFFPSNFLVHIGLHSIFSINVCIVNYII